MKTIEINSFPESNSSKSSNKTTLSNRINQHLQLDFEEIQCNPSSDWGGVMKKTVVWSLPRLNWSDSNSSSDQTTPNHRMNRSSSSYSFRSSGHLFLRHYSDSFCPTLFDGGMIHMLTISRNFTSNTIWKHDNLMIRNKITTNRFVLFVDVMRSPLASIFLKTVWTYRYLFRSYHDFLRARMKIHVKHENKFCINLIHQTMSTSDKISMIIYVSTE